MALLENYQQEVIVIVVQSVVLFQLVPYSSSVVQDGSVLLPEALCPYIGQDSRHIRPC